MSRWVQHASRGRAAGVGTYVIGFTTASSTFKALSYKVTAISAAVGAAGNITTDRPVQLPLQTSDAIEGIIPTQNVKIYGNGMRLTTSGTGTERLVELLTCWNCYVSGLILDGSAGGVVDRLMSIDEASYRSTAEQITGDCGATTTIGFSTESNEGTTYRDTTATNCPNGIVDQDGVQCSYENDHATNCTAGFTFNTGSASTDLTGGTGSIVLGGSYVTNVTGIAVNYGQNETVDGPFISYGTNGVQIGATQTVSGTIVRGIKATNNSASGVVASAHSVGAKVLSSVFAANGSAAVYADAGSSGTVVGECDISGVIGLHAKAPVSASKLSGTCSSYTVDLDNAASAVTLSNSVFTPTYAGYAFDLATSGAVLSLDGVSILGEPSGNFAIAVYGGTTLNANSLTITGTRRTLFTRSHRRA